MFPPSFQRAGYIPDGTQVADPANDPKLLEETRDHYWIEFNTGSGFQDADTTFAQSFIGETFIAVQNTFAEVPDALRHKTTVRLDAEEFGGLSIALFGVEGFSGGQVTTVLNQTFNDVDLVGRPLSIGNFVSSRGASLVVSYVTNTYSPYIALGDVALPDSSHDEIIRGQDYQEVLTNTLLYDQILTGLFLNIELSGPDGPAESYQRALVDRIGYANRQEGTFPRMDFDPKAPSILTNFDVFTLNVSPSLQDPRTPALLFRQASQLKGRLDALFPDPNQQYPFTPERLSLLRDYAIALTRFLGANFLFISDRSTSGLAHVASIQAYFNRPRVIITSNQTQGLSQNLIFSQGVDLRRDKIRTIADPSQSNGILPMFQFMRGLFESGAEEEVLEVSSPQGQRAISALELFRLSIAQGIQPLILTSKNAIDIDRLSISAEAKSRVAKALDSGKAVLIPAHSVNVSGTDMVAWFEMDLVTGETLGVMENGTGGAAEYILTFLITFGATGSGSFAGASLGILIYGRAVKEKFTLNAISLSTVFAVAVNHLAGASGTIKIFGAALGGGAGSQIGFGAGIGLAFMIWDPPIGPWLYDVGLTSLVPSNYVTQSLRLLPLIVGQLPVDSLGSVDVGSARLKGNIHAKWDVQGTSGLQAKALAANGVVRDATGALVGPGTILINNTEKGIPVDVSGRLNFDVRGAGDLSAHAPASTNLGVSGEWEEYTATISGDVTLRLTTADLTLNGTPLPEGTYTITTSSATLTGSGPSTSPDFAGSVSIAATDGTLQLGPGTGTVTVAGQAIDPSTGLTLSGFNGSLSVTAGASTDTVAFQGNSSNVLRVSADSTTITTDQNTPASFHVVVQTSLADTYDITAEAPAGWTATIDDSGQVAVTPAPGLQGGTFPIRLTARSQSHPELVAQDDVLVSLTPTQPGITLAVEPDPLFTVPSNGAQVPTAFRAEIHNAGPTAETIDLTFPTLPDGFTVLNSGTHVTIPAGQTGIVGIYLQPNGPIPPPGTPISFQVTATSTTDPGLTAAQTVSFTMPEVHGVTLVSDPPALNTTPGAPTTATLTLKAVGNVPESVTLAANPSVGLTVNGLGPVTLEVGESKTETITLTPDAATPLNSTLFATVTATFGPSESPLTQTVPILVQVVVPGAGQPRMRQWPRGNSARPTWRPGSMISPSR